MDEKIIELMKSAFNTDDITTMTSQSNCEKWDSLHHLNLIVELEDAFDMEFEPEEIAEMKSFSTIKQQITAKQGK
ncbi:acyl carrier protein [uncultured Duncaniella sp.]|uniref:acyl carrier protein n=1 Tax=uncultured Duncaniella sp. TaxID=2768039 RepID=UPI002657B9FE|nr:acyl carrier protein [uncultured Duncaniella sp.]